MGRKIKKSRLKRGFNEVQPPVWGMKGAETGSSRLKNGIGVVIIEHLCYDIQEGKPQMAGQLGS